MKKLQPQLVELILEHSMLKMGDTIKRLDFGPPRPHLPPPTSHLPSAFACSHSAVAIAIYVFPSDSDARGHPQRTPS